MKTIDRWNWVHLALLTVAMVPVWCTVLLAESGDDRLTTAEMARLTGGSGGCVEVTHTDCNAQDEPCVNCLESLGGYEHVDRSLTCPTSFKDYVNENRTSCDTTVPDNDKCCEQQTITCWAKRDCDSTMIADRVCSASDTSISTDTSQGFWCKACSRGLVVHASIAPNDKCVNCQ